MHRALAVAALIALAGCVAGLGGVTDFEDEGATTGEQWGDDPIVVAIDGDGDRNYTPFVREAVDYWEANGSRYAAYDAEFVLRPDAGDPDLVVDFVPEVGQCGDVSGPAGCAPRLSADDRVDTPLTVEIQSDLSNESTVFVAKHEFGHVLGLTHDDEPQDVMAHESSLATLPKPNATERALPWNDSTLTVAVDAANASDPEEVREQVRHALDYYERGGEGTVPENVSFRLVENRSAADVVVDFTDELPCDDGTGSCGTRGGVDVDEDGELERYNRLRISVSDVDTDAVGWHVGYWLGYGFGFTDGSDWPDPFRDADSDDRRSEWWR